MKAKELIALLQERTDEDDEVMFEDSCTGYLFSFYEVRVDTKDFDGAPICNTVVLG